METKLSISLAELRQLLNGSKGVIVVDVRSSAEYNGKHIPFAVHLPVEQLETGKSNLDFKKIIVTACGKGGGRSERAARHIRDNHFSEAYFLEGGTFGWFENENLSKQ